jgi:hypothetical protein
MGEALYKNNTCEGSERNASFPSILAKYIRGSGSNEMTWYPVCMLCSGSQRPYFGLLARNFVLWFGRQCAYSGLVALLRNLVWQPVSNVHNLVW